MNPRLQNSIRYLILLPVMIVMGCGRESDPERDRARAILLRAVNYLWDKQAADGGWHSETHGILRGGEAWTPFVLLALNDVPSEIMETRSDGIRRGVEFIRTHTTQEGVLGISDPDVLEYPNYATSYAVRLLSRVSPRENKALIGRMQRYLRSEQLTEQRGFTKDDLVYGAWGFGETNLPPGTPGFADLSHTRRVLQALVETSGDDSSAGGRSQLFLRLLQKHPAENRKQPGDGSPEGLAYDGGFYFSPVVLTRNKGGLEESGVFRSYATATCDGVLALVFAGVPQNDERVQSALHWLMTHPVLDRPEGIPSDTPEQWQEVMFFYHLMVRSEVYSFFDVEGDWRTEMVNLIAGGQRPDGSFANPAGELNKEDDPLLATAMVVYTLTNALR